LRYEYPSRRRIGAAVQLTRHLGARSTRAEELVMANLIAGVRALLRDEEGQDLIEYELLAGLIALVSTVALTAAGVKVNTIWEGIDQALGEVPAAAAP
jgi:pilus assembly protein Flp/PilA